MVRPTVSPRSMRDHAVRGSRLHYLPPQVGVSKPADRPRSRLGRVQRVSQLQGFDCRSCHRRPEQCRSLPRCHHNRSLYRSAAQETTNHGHRRIGLWRSKRHWSTTRRSLHGWSQLAVVFLHQSALRCSCLRAPLFLSEHPHRRAATSTDDVEGEDGPPRSHRNTLFPPKHHLSIAGTAVGWSDLQLVKLPHNCPPGALRSPLRRLPVRPEVERRKRHRPRKHHRGLLVFLVLRRRHAECSTTSRSGSKPSKARRPSSPAS